jgi:hypothetical protein
VSATEAIGAAGAVGAKEVGGLDAGLGVDMEGEEGRGPAPPPIELGEEAAHCLPPRTGTCAACARAVLERAPTVAPRSVTPTAGGSPSRGPGLATPGMPRWGQSRTCSTKVSIVFHLGMRPGATLRIPIARAPAKVSATMAASAMRFTRRPPLSSSKTNRVPGPYAPVPDEMLAYLLFRPRRPVGKALQTWAGNRDGAPATRAVDAS